MWGEEGQKIVQHLSIKIELKKYVQKTVYKQTKKLYVKKRKLYVKRKKVVCKKKKLYLKIKKIVPG